MPPQRMFSFSSSSETLHTPMARILPCCLSLSSTAMVSAMGVWSGGALGQWVWYRSMQSTSEPAQAVLDLDLDRVGPQAAIDLLAVQIGEEAAARILPPKPALGGEHGLVAPALEGLAHHALAAAPAVGGRGVDEVDAESSAAWMVRTDSASSVSLPQSCPPPSTQAPRPTMEAEMPELPRGFCFITEIRLLQNLFIKRYRLTARARTRPNPASWSAVSCEVLPCWSLWLAVGQHIAQRRRRTVVQIGRGAPKLDQRRRVEGVGVPVEPAARAHIVGLQIGEQRPGMALGAARLLCCGTASRRACAAARACPSPGAGWAPA